MQGQLTWSHNVRDNTEIHLKNIITDPKNSSALDRMDSYRQPIAISLGLDWDGRQGSEEGASRPGKSLRQTRGTISLATRKDIVINQISSIKE